MTILLAYWGFAAIKSSFQMAISSIVYVLLGKKNLLMSGITVPDPDVIPLSFSGNAMGSAMGQFTK